MKEYLLDTDKYNKPRVIKDKDALAILIMRLLIMKPGTHPRHPEMGIDIIGRYRYCDINDLDDIRREISDQMEIYLSEYRTTDIICSIENKDLKISVNIDDTLFNFSTSTNTSTNEISLRKQE